MAFASTNTLNESSMMVTKAGLAETVPFNTLKASGTDSWIRNRSVGGSKLHAMKLDWAPNDSNTLQKSIMDHAEYTLARTKYNFDKLAAYQATAYSVRDRTIERFNETQQYHTDVDPKRLYYLSLEFLMGRSLQNSIYNLGLKNEYTTALLELGYKLEDAYEEERDAALGNGGLGRLAACFVDSMATLNYPCWGYGIRYHYGMFKQGIYDGFQTEMPDYWLSWGNPWELERIDVQYPVRFYGHVVEEYKAGSSEPTFRWEGGEQVRAVAYDTPVLGYKTVNCNNIRLWASKPSMEFDLAQFNEGNYLNAVEAKQRSENITSVLYPNDNTYSGKELRLKQQYFFVSATLSDVVRRFKKTHSDWNMFHQKVAIQLNDTHPTIGIVELLRKFLDEEGLSWDVAWNIVTNVYAYTNHTVLPEALEMWSVGLIQHLLPRHMQLIYQINHRFLRVIEKKWPGDVAKMRRVSIIDEDGEKRVRMAHLAIVGSHAVNGVAAMHSEIVKKSVFPDFYELWPQKFTNVTNGVTPRRWIQQANPTLTQLLNKTLKTDNWPIELELIANLRNFANDTAFQHEWKNMKLANKHRLAAYIHKVVGVQVNPNSLFDVHVKRIHEYKRQLLNILSVIHRYLTIKKASPEERKKIVSRVIIFAGKAAPGYLMAKRHIKLINSVAAVVNADAEVGDLLKVVFLPNYCVSMAEVIVPGSDINQQISTAGTEASGTSNMKFAMNGSIIIGTLDGANVEIAEEVGVENLFIFGLKAEQIEHTRREFREGRIKPDPRLEEVYKAIHGGMFGSAEVFRPILDGLQVSDFYLVTPDFPLYLECQEKVDKLWQNETAWLKQSILNAAGTSKFNSDRSINEYAKNIWNIHPVDVPKTNSRAY